MFLGEGSQKPQARPFAKKSLSGSLLEPIMGYWQAQTENWILKHTGNDSEMKKAAEEKKLHRMAKVHDFLEMWQGSRNLRVTQKESRAQNKQMTAVRYISDTEESVQASWSLFQYDGAAAFKLSERSPLPPALSTKNLPGGRTQILNVRRIWRIYRHPFESDDDNALQSISDTDDWLNTNGDLDNPPASEDGCAADDESDIGPNNGIEDPECPEEQDVSATPNVPRFVRPTQMSKREAEKLLVTDIEVETQRNKGGKKKYDRMCQWFISFMQLDREFQLEIYYR
jgi:hypothetical protein